MNNQDVDGRLPVENRFDALKPGALSRVEKDAASNWHCPVGTPLAGRTGAVRADATFLRLKLVRIAKHSVRRAVPDNRHRVIGWPKCFRGTIDGASVHPGRGAWPSSSTPPRSSFQQPPFGGRRTEPCRRGVTRRLRPALARWTYGCSIFVVAAGEACRFAGHDI